MKFVNETMSWSELWAECFIDDDFFNEPSYWSSTAREYDRKIPENSRLFEKLKKYVNRNSTVLDIGAGTGYLTLALAPFVKKVNALEPAEGMLNILREKAQNLGIHNIDYLNGRWEDARIGEYDIVLASHSISCTKDPLTFFLRMHECASRFVFLIVFTDFDIMSMVGRKIPQPSYALLYNMLCSLGIYANVEIFKSYRRFFYTCKEDAIKNLNDRMNKEYIHRNLQETNGEFFMDIETDEVMIWYEKGDAIMNQMQLITSSQDLHPAGKQDMIRAF